MERRKVWNVYLSLMSFKDINDIQNKIEFILQKPQIQVLRNCLEESQGLSMTRVQLLPRNLEIDEF